MNFQVNVKEKIYFIALLIINAIFWVSCILQLMAKPIAIIPFTLYLGMFLLFNIVTHLFFIGYIKGNALKVSAQQFPEIFAVVKQQAKALELSTTPEIYILQGNGVLNAFATRFSGNNCIVLLSNIVEAAYQAGMPAIEFIIGHELGHIKQNHVSFLKWIVLFPAQYIPLLGAAYSRAREYTCDNIGYSLCPEGAHQGLVILAAGTQLYKKVNLDALVMQAHKTSGFALRFTERFSTHPHLLKRIAALEIPAQEIKFEGASSYKTQNTLSMEDAASSHAAYIPPSEHTDEINH